MSHALTVVQNDGAPPGSGEFNQRQLAEAYGTIFALKLKLELGARDLAQLCEAQRPPNSVFTNSAIETSVETAISDRAHRSDTLPASLFSDPAWDMMLELYRAELHQYKVPVSNLCIASQVPATTALRWISKLELGGLAVRDADPFDGRRYYMRLTANASKAMLAYFSARPALQEAQRCAR